jgi:hypothetical protein
MKMYSIFIVELYGSPEFLTTIREDQEQELIDKFIKEIEKTYDEDEYKVEWMNEDHLQKDKNIVKVARFEVGLNEDYEDRAKFWIEFRQNDLENVKPFKYL